MENSKAFLFLGAASNGDLVTVNAMIADSIDVNSKGPKNVTPILAAMDNGHEDCVLSLFLAGADVNAVDEFGHTLLGLALDYKSSDMAALCVAMGCDASAFSDRILRSTQKVQKTLAIPRVVSAVSQQLLLNERYGQSINPVGLVVKALTDLQRQLPEQEFDREVLLAIKLAKRKSGNGGLGNQGGEILGLLRSWRAKTEAWRGLAEIVQPPQSP